MGIEVVCVMRVDHEDAADLLKHRLYVEMCLYVQHRIRVSVRLCLYNVPVLWSTKPGLLYKPSFMSIYVANSDKTLNASRASWG